MKSNLALYNSDLFPETLYDESFFEDSLDLFLDLRSGHLGKYTYGEEALTQQTHTDGHPDWHKSVNEEDNSYYLPSAEKNILSQATLDISKWIPGNTSVVDFGVGGIDSFKELLVPLLNKIESGAYYGIDFCQPYLSAIKTKGPLLCKARIHPIHKDFFLSSTTITPDPALGVMLCSTIGNMNGSVREKIVGPNLVRALRTISKQTNRGWLLVSVDTNQASNALQNAYETPAVEQFVLSSFRRMARELPMEGFDPTLFTYAPEWHADIQLFAHIAVATADQDFTLGSYRLHIAKGQKLHLLNSYKFAPSFFEACCDQANLEILQVWHHESPMKLYLLIDRDNPTFTAQNASEEPPSEAA